jgi:hypothetical protein
MHEADHSHLAWGLRMVEPYHHSPVCLHCIGLNQLNTGKTLPFHLRSPHLLKKQILDWVIMNSLDRFADSGLLKQFFYWMNTHMKGPRYNLCIFSAFSTSTIGVYECSWRYNLIKFLRDTLLCEIHILGVDVTHIYRWTLHPQCLCPVIFRPELSHSSPHSLTPVYPQHVVLV